MEENERLYWADLLRILATLAVIGLHVCSGDFFNNGDVYSSEWLTVNFYGSLTKWCVPVFVMISGMMFLNPQKEVTLKSIYKKYLPRLAVAFLLWSVVYIVAFNRDRLFNINAANLKYLFERLVMGHYHMWFIYMMIGLYLVTPFLRVLVKNCSRKMLEYFLLLWLVFSIIIPVVRMLPNTWLVGQVTGHLGMGFVTTYVGYFVLGYYLSSIPLNKKQGIWMSSAFLLGGAVTIGISTALSLLEGTANRLAHGNNVPNVMLMAAGVFVFFRVYVAKIKINERISKIILEVSSCCFGIYLVHVIFIEVLNKIGMKITTFHPLISAPIMIASIFIASLVFTFILRKFKLGRKYLS